MKNWILGWVLFPLTGLAITDLAPQLEPVRKEYELPSLAAVLVKDGEIVAEGVVGSRRADRDVPATLDDRYHLGSDTKAMTALLAAQLVEEGKLSWDLTLAEAFPEFKEKIPETIRSATLEQILSHSSGLPGDNDALFAWYFDVAKEMRPLPESRLWLIERGLSLDPVGAPGEKFVYSNLGYIVAGAIIERAAGQTWESLIHEQIFEPMGLQSAGLGPQNSLGLVDAPLPHLVDQGEVFIMEGGPTADIPAVMGSAGNAHMSPRDFAKWAAWHAGAGKREPQILDPDLVEQLHQPRIATPTSLEEKPGTPRIGQYALGWGVLPFPWSDKTFLMHGGSNGMNLAWIVVRPEDDLGLVLLTNIGGDKANSAFEKLAESLLSPYVTTSGD